MRHRISATSQRFKSKLRNTAMRDRNQMDNLYEEGSIITAKENPELKLIITKYCQRIYHCRAVGEPEGRAFAYFERNLIAPVQNKL